MKTTKRPLALTVGSDKYTLADVVLHLTDQRNGTWSNYRKAHVSLKFTVNDHTQRYVEFDLQANLDPETEPATGCRMFWPGNDATPMSFYGLTSNVRLRSDGSLDREGQLASALLKRLQRTAQKTNSDYVTHCELGRLFVNLHALGVDTVRTFWASSPSTQPNNETTLCTSPGYVTW